MKKSPNTYTEHPGHKENKGKGKREKEVTP